MAGEVRLQLRVSQDFNERLEAYAERQGVSKTDVLVEAAEKLMDEEDDGEGSGARATELPKLVAASELAPPAPQNSRLDPYPGAPTEPEARREYFKRRSEAMRNMDTGGRQSFGTGKPERS